MPILFFGTEDFSATFLEMLIAERYDIRAVVTKPDSKKGRGQKVSAPLVKKIARAHNIAVWQPEKLSEIMNDIKQISTVTGVLVSYGKIIPQSIIELFSPGIINVHPSLLPKYRGPSPIESAILHGDTKTGVSIMQLTKAMDAGPIYSQTEIALRGNETQMELYSILQKNGVAELQRVLSGITSGLIAPVAQNEAEASYCSLVTKADAIIDWHESATKIEQKIRAYRSWPQARTKNTPIELIVLSAEITDEKIAPGKTEIRDTQFLIGTATNALSLKMVKIPGKKEMPIQAFLSGYKNKF